MTEPQPLPEDWCWSHARVEPSLPDAHRVCFECGHVFPTAEDLVRDVRVLEYELRIFDAERDSAPMPQWDIDPQTWPTCPHCTHDF